MLKARSLIPLGIFVALLVFLGVGLTLNPREVPSPLIGKPAPAFELPRLDRADASFSQKDMLGKVWMLNVWASWCIACRDEHAVLVEFSKKQVVPILGLNYKDERSDGLKWLARFGNPYQLSIYDHEGQVGIDYGVYGVPETFLIDKRGVIRYKRIGALTPELIQDKILPLIRELETNA
jgi:cytochrome c biogenesis protein CcmG/thiol:disulfide interchange protein DsbE